jgi:hypothetical protein
MTGPTATWLDTQQVTTNRKAVVQELHPSLQLIRDLRTFYRGAGCPSLPADRPSSWRCPACNVWGRDIRPAACWSCGTRNVDYRVAPSMTGGHRFYEPEEGTTELLPNDDDLSGEALYEQEAT